MKINDILSEDDTPLKIKAVSGNDVTLDQNGEEIKTTTDALAPGQQPGTFAMKPTDPNSIKPGAQVSQPMTTQEEINDEEDEDLIGSGHNHDIGGDATDNFIDQVTDKKFQRFARGDAVVGNRSQMSRSVAEELARWKNIAGL